MKHLKRIAACFLAAVFFILVNPVFAQTSSPDSVVSLEAEAAGLSLVPSIDLPHGGTYWLVMPGAGLMAPMPCPPMDTNLPVYAMSDNGQFLVDQTDGGYGMSAIALTNQMNAVSNLILQVQTTDAARAMRQIAASIL